MMFVYIVVELTWWVPAADELVVMSSRGRGVVNSHGRGGQVRDTRQGRATATNQSVTSQSNVTVAPAKQTTRQSRPYQQRLI